MIYRVAVGAVGGSFSLAEAGLEFVLGAAGGIAIGLAVGWVIAEIRKRLDDPPVEVTISILSGYAAYVPAERVGASGVLAAVTIGIYIGWRAPEISNRAAAGRGLLDVDDPDVPAQRPAVRADRAAAPADPRGAARTSRWAS